MPLSAFLKRALPGILLAASTSLVAAKGSSGPNPCTISYLNCPTVITGTSGSLTDELVNNSFSGATLAIAYALPSMPSGDVASFALTGPGNGANLLPFLASATLNALSATGTPLFSLSAANFDPTGNGGLPTSPVSVTQAGVTLSAAASGFEGGLSFEAVDQSGAPIALTLDLTIPASGYGQVNVTNTYAIDSVSPVPEPSAALEAALGLTGLIGLSLWRRTPGRTVPSRRPPSSRGPVIARAAPG